MEDIFRFMAFRPPIFVPDYTNSHIYTTNLESQFQNKLIAAQATADALKQFKAEAKKFITSADYVTDVARLRYPLAARAMPMSV